MMLQLPASTSPVDGFVRGRLNDGGGVLVLQAGDQPCAITAVIAEPIGIDPVVRIACLIVDLETNLAIDVGADRSSEALDLG